MTSAIATDARGNRLLAVNRASADDLVVAARLTPCPLALVVVMECTTRDVLFGLNTWRHEYELPGGMVEGGESFAEAARRELEEETGIRADALQLLGYARFALTDPIREELGAVYVAETEGRGTTTSDEMSHFVWRRPLSASQSRVSALDDAIADWAVGTVSTDA